MHSYRPVHKDTANALHLQRDDLLHYQMNCRIFSSCYQCADHILSTPINILVTANLRNLAQYSFLSRCYEGKEIFLVRRTRCTAGLCPDKWPFPGFNSSRKGILESKWVFQSCLLNGQALHLSPGFFGWWGLKPLFDIPFLHVSLLLRDSLKCASFVLLNSSVL